MTASERCERVASFGILKAGVSNNAERWQRCLHIHELVANPSVEDKHTAGSAERGVESVEDDGVGDEVGVLKTEDAMSRVTRRGAVTRV